MSKKKPVYVMHEEGLSDLVKRAVLDGVKEVLRIAEVDNLIEVVDLGVWKSENYKDYLDRDGSLKEYQSVDWYLQEARKRSRDKNRIDASTLLELLELPRPFKKHSVLVLHSDIYRQDGRSIVGLASYGSPGGIVLSTNKLKDLDEETKHGCIKTAAMHEAGHNYGLVYTTA